MHHIYMQLNSTSQTLVIRLNLCPVGHVAAIGATRKKKTLTSIKDSLGNIYHQMLEDNRNIDL